MDFLYNYKGKHIATLINGQLYSVKGANIGHFLKSSNIFIDIRGNYLGQVPFANRLLYSDIYAYDGISFGSLGDFGNIGYIGDIGEVGNLDVIDGFSDIPVERLR